MKKESPQEFINRTSKEALSKLEDFFYSPEKINDYIEFQSKFYNYSPRNQLLIAKQYSGAQGLAPYKKWQEKGYNVQKGEKAIQIMVPAEKKTFIRHENKDKSIVPVSKATPKEKNMIKNNEIHINKQIYFIKGSVFDIQQTNAPQKEYPEILKQLKGDVPDYDDKMNNLLNIAQANNINVKKSKDSMEGARGAYIETSNGEKIIELNKNNFNNQNLKTLVHELGHHFIHGSENKTKDQNLSKNDKEFQAEMTALIVGDYLGLENKDKSVEYIYGYAKDMNSERKLELMKDVQKVSSNIIKAVDGNDGQDIYFGANKNSNRTYIKADDIKNNTYIRKDQLYTLQDVNYLSKEMYSSFNPSLVYKNSESTKIEIVKGLRYDYAPLQTNLTQHDLYEHVQTISKLTDSNSKKYIDREMKQDNIPNLEIINNFKNEENER